MKKSIRISEIVNLKEKGKSLRDIEEYYKEKNIDVSYRTIGRMLNKYYTAKGEDVPRGAKISDEELLKFRKQGMTCNAISNEYKKKGIEISERKIGERLKEYYIKHGKKDQAKSLKKGTKHARKFSITEKELADLKEKRLSYKDISEYYKKQGVEISEDIIQRILKKYYDLQGRRVPVATRLDVSDEEIVKLSKEGMTCREIHEHFEKNKISISMATIYNRLKKYREKEEIEKIYYLDDKIKEILLTGRSIKNYCIQEKCESDEPAIRERIKKFKLIVEHSQKQGDKWIPDNNFLDVIRVLESIGNFRPGDKYRIYLRPYIREGICTNGNITSIKRNVFQDNTDLMTYILSSYQLRYGEEYDIKVWNKLKKEYEAKIDKYFNRLHILEKNSRNKQKQNKKSKKADEQIQNEVAKKEVNNPNQGDER